MGRLVNWSTHGVLIYGRRLGAREREGHLGHPSEVVFGGSGSQTVILRETVASGMQ